MAPSDPTPAMRIDHSELKRAAKQFAREDASLSSEAHLILGKIASLGDIYGADNSGRQATQRFQQAQDNITKYIKSLCGAYGKTSDALTLTENNVAVANWNIVATLPEIATGADR